MTRVLSLHRDLENAVQQGVKFRPFLVSGDARELYGTLSHVIAGPPGYGKTWQAHEYAGALFDEKFVDAQDPVTLYPASGLRDGKWTEVFDAAKGKVLVIDEIYGVDPRAGNALLARIVEFMSKNEGVVVLTGDAERLQSFIDNAPVLKKILTNTVMLDRPPTQAEIDAGSSHSAEKRAQRAKAAADAVDAERKRIETAAQWRETKDNDITAVKGSVTAPRTASFRKNKPVLQG